MIRFQSPDVIVLDNGRKPILKASMEEYDAEGVHGFPNCSPLEPKLLRVKHSSGSGYQSPNRDRPFFHISSSEAPHSNAFNGASPDDVLFQWGHRKRSRWLRAEGRASVASAERGDDSPIHSRQVLKLHRRSSAATAGAAVLPPPCGPCATSTRRSCVPGRGSTASLVTRSVQERSEGRARPEERRSPEKPPKTSPASACSEAADASMNPDPVPPSDPKPTERINLDHFEWPRIHLSLSRKEKEDDFMAMKGTKLPQRPKKRAKNIDRTLQFCYPGMWLSDLTAARYEVREKKCKMKKKKRRGLKGMQSMVDSDSE
ncbi:uncharacterized protein LOC122006275 isoform X2 [Zingiber officinale]|uniref:uncharacterized protein LOC122006275 isoform X2 n=1 Tax=Zingiber officinale TaxID=94328 RepID=UPI001C4C5E24|nr:uncharacterized protein LOC122006275 isoform X2 [Zingiber officinale]